MDLKFEFVGSHQ